MSSTESVLYNSNTTKINLIVTTANCRQPHFELSLGLISEADRERVFYRPNDEDCDAWTRRAMRDLTPLKGPLELVFDAREKIAHGSRVRDFSATTERMYAQEVVKRVNEQLEGASYVPVEREVNANRRISAFAINASAERAEKIICDHEPFLAKGWNRANWSTLLSGAYEYRDPSAIWRETEESKSASESQWEEALKLAWSNFLEKRASWTAGRSLQR